MLGETLPLISNQKSCEAKVHGVVAHAGDASGIGRQLEAQLCACTARLSHEQKGRLVSWLAEVPPDLFGAHIVRPLQRYISAVASRQVRMPSLADHIALAQQGPV